MDPRRLINKDPIWVDQQHLPVGGDVAQNLGWVLIEDSIQCLGRDIGLLEFDHLMGVDIETLPVDDQILGDLIDPGGALIWGRDIALAGGHHTTFWIGKSGSCMKDEKEGYGEGNFEKIAENSVSEISTGRTKK
tara:strand:- start:461 stop:862 length:402 start_codon:yes stop_codon:yes gene_type:complete